MGELIESAHLNIGFVAAALARNISRQVVDFCERFELVVAGGWVRDTILGIKPKDIDLFTLREIPPARWDAMRLFWQNLVDSPSRPSRQTVYYKETKWANTLHGAGMMVFMPDLPVQIIKFTGWRTVDDLLGAFDFGINATAFGPAKLMPQGRAIGGMVPESITFGKRLGNWGFQMKPRFAEDLGCRTLRLQPDSSPLRQPLYSLTRVISLASRTGLTVTASSLATIVSTLVREEMERRILAGLTGESEKVEADLAQRINESLYDNIQVAPEFRADAKESRFDGDPPNR